MNKISELKAILGENFDWNKARLDCFARMILALFIVRTVNLSEIAVAFASKADVACVIKDCKDFSVILNLITLLLPNGYSNYF